MLDSKTANLIMHAVNSSRNKSTRGKLVSISEVKRMKRIESPEDDNCSVFTLQKGELTILVQLYTVLDFGIWETKFAKVQFVQ